jgi:hypothetical protein
MSADGVQAILRARRLKAAWRRAKGKQQSVDLDQPHQDPSKRVHGLGAAATRVLRSWSNVSSPAPGTARTITCNPPNCGRSRKMARVRRRNRFRTTAIPTLRGTIMPTNTDDSTGRPDDRSDDSGATVTTTWRPRNVRPALRTAANAGAPRSENRTWPMIAVGWAGRTEAALGPGRRDEP